MNSIPKLAVLALFLFLNIHYSFSQTNLSELKDFSSLKVNQLSDNDIKNYIQNAKESGMSESDILSTMIQKGLTQEEVEKFRLRMTTVTEFQRQASPTVKHEYAIPVKQEIVQGEDVDLICWGRIMS